MKKNNAAHNIERRQILFDLTSNIQKNLEHLMLEVIEELVDAKLHAQLGLKIQRIGVFGPYTYISMQEKMASYIASRNFTSILSHGYYTPDNPTILKPITNILSEEIFELIENRLVINGLVRCVNKAFIILQEIRTQLFELDAAFKFNVPITGLIIHSQIPTSTVDYCPFLNLDEGYAECIVPSPMLCPAKHSQPNQYFCPFVDVFNLPCYVLDILHSEKNKLIVIKDENELPKVIDQLLDAL